MSRLRLLGPALAALASLVQHLPVQAGASLYGVLDLSADRVSAGGTSLTRVSTSGLSTSRLGVKGDEDLGGGLKARFALETAVSGDTGANGGGVARFFDRQAHVALATRWGEFRLGRTDSPLGLVADMAGTQAFDDLSIVGARGSGRYRRVDNSLTYLLPVVVTGLSGQVQYALAAAGFGGSGVLDARVAGGEGAGKAWGFNLAYATGPFQAALGYLASRDENVLLAGRQGANAATALVSYDTGVAKFMVFANAETNAAAQAGGQRMATLGAKVAVPVGADLLLTAGASRTRGTTEQHGDDDHVTIFSLKGVYTLSRRTSLYGWLVSIDNEEGAAKGLIAPEAGQSGRGLAFGVRHLF